MTETPQTPAPQEPAPAPAGPGAAPAGKNALAIVGMILGIVGLVLFCVLYVSLPCAIVGLILSILGSKKAKETGVGAGMAKAGIILCVIALAIAVLMFIIGAAVLAWLGMGGAEKLAEEAGRALPTTLPAP